MRFGKRERRILQLLAEEGPLRLLEIYRKYPARTDEERRKVRRSLYGLVEKGVVLMEESLDGIYFRLYPSKSLLEKLGDRFY